MKDRKQILLQKGIKSVLFPNLIDLTQIPVIPNPTQNYFIYVGGLTNVKELPNSFKLLRMPLHAQFKVIGPPRDKTGYIYYEKLKSFQNVSLLGRIKPFRYIAPNCKSKALISTSHMEGFPNIFIEAWAYGIPVLSLYVDPGSVIEKEKLGELPTGDLDMIVASNEKSSNSNEFAKRAKAYVEHNHVLNAAKIEEISCIFSELVNQGIK